MSYLTPSDTSALIATITPRLAALDASGAARQAPTPPAAPDRAARDAERGRLLRRALEEWGVTCREDPGLTVLEAFGIASARGVEIIVAADLAPAERALAYARGLVRLTVQEPTALATWFHYRPGAAPEHQTPAECRAMAVVDAMAHALLRGCLDAAPRYLHTPSCAEAPDAPPTSLLGGCSRAILGGLHRASSALYWHSESYQALRASTPMIRLTSGVHALLSARAA
jgi:hypothetical protein